MADQTPEGAVEAYLEPIRRVLACVTNVHLAAFGYHAAEYPHSLTFGASKGREGSDPVRLYTRHGKRGLAFGFAQGYVIDERPHDTGHGRFAVRTTENMPMRFST